MPPSRRDCGGALPPKAIHHPPTTSRVFPAYSTRAVRQGAPGDAPGLLPLFEESRHRIPAVRFPPTPVHQPRRHGVCFAATGTREIHYRLGELNGSDHARWLRTVEVFNEQGEGLSGTVAAKLAFLSAVPVKRAASRL